VLDLGAAPGSWTMYAAERVGRAGRVVAIDLSEIRERFGENVTVLRGDVLAPEPDTLETLERFSPYDVVLSDMAPNTSGSKISDQARSQELFMKALEVAKRLGKPRSSFAAKIFMSGDFPIAKRAVEAAYGTTRILKPEGTRPNSSEIYVVGFDKR
jgi:23S rRNA (uridine2552-2'-O)-methyltransferase